MSTVNAIDFSERVETNEIKKEIARRGITRLCHMTRVSNLINILDEETGLLADDFIAPTKLYRNDPDRLDGKTDYIS